MDTEEMTECRAIMNNYENTLGVRIDAWAKWCKLFDEQEAAEQDVANGCKAYAL